jgi:hypothetical protein
MGGGAVEITAEMIEQARLRGACKKALDVIHPGDSVEVLTLSMLDWIGNSDMWTIEASRDMIGSDSVLVCGKIPAMLFSRSGSGDGSGYGYGYGDGDGYGDGYGYGAG